MPQIYIPIKKIAETLGVDRSNARKIILNYGFAPIKVRTLESKKQLTLALTKEEAQELYEKRIKNGYNSDNQKAMGTENGKGEFYLIQLVPELDPKRIKLGFASNAKLRLQSHRTAAPTAKLVKSWPCKKIWEQAVIDSITRYGCSKIGIEVFQIDTLKEIIKKADSFFEIMPKV